MSFVLRRFAFYAVAIFVAISFNFLIPRLMPGILWMQSCRGTGTYAFRDLGSLQRDAGFRRRSPVAAISAVPEKHCDLGFGSYHHAVSAPVSELLAIKLPWTVGLAGMSTVVSVSIGLLIGTYAAYHRGGFTDKFMPGFWAFVGLCRNR